MDKLRWLSKLFTAGKHIGVMPCSSINLSLTELIMISILDYGVGNISAILNMFNYLGFEAKTVKNAEGILAAERLVLPGVGAFDNAMKTLSDRDLIQPLNYAVLKRHTPVLGICLGMHLLAHRSEEGRLDGLGWIPAEVRLIRPSQGSQLKVPHIGWADVKPVNRHELFSHMSSCSEPNRFYFNHSYHIICHDPSDMAAIFQYDDQLCCALQHDNITGVQFHPEKSHRFGISFLERWVRLTGNKVDI